MGEGLYESAKTTYTMEFDYKGRKVSASTEIPAKPTNFVINKTKISLTQIDLLRPSFAVGSGDLFGGGE